MPCLHSSTSIKRVGLQIKLVEAHTQYATVLWCSHCGALALQNGEPVDLDAGWAVDAGSILPAFTKWEIPLNLREQKDQDHA